MEEGAPVELVRDPVKPLKAGLLEAIIWLEIDILTLTAEAFFNH